MTHVPDQPVLGGVENIMQRHGQFDHAQTGAEMAAGDGDDVDHIAAQLLGELAQRAFGQLAQIGGDVDLVEKRCLGRQAHGVTVFRGMEKRAYGAVCWDNSDL